MWEVWRCREVPDAILRPHALVTLLQEFKGYVFKIMGGQDKEGFPMKQGVLTNGRVRLLMHRCANRARFSSSSYSYGLPGLREGLRALSEQFSPSFAAACRASVGTVAATASAAGSPSAGALSPRTSRR